MVHEREGDWVMVDLRCDFLRLAVREPHRVEARCLRAGRTLGLADVHIAPWDRPERVVAVGRAHSRGSSGPAQGVMWRSGRTTRVRSQLVSDLRCGS